MLLLKGVTVLIKNVKTTELFNCTNDVISPLFENSGYPWEILPKIKEYVLSLIEKGIEGYTRLSQGVLVGEDVKIYPTATIEAPAIIGAGSVIRPGAFIRGNVIIGEKCVIGNSSELKNCILLDCVEIPHYNYVGDSILGNHTHTGAGTICSNLKTDGKTVVVHGNTDYDTGLRKVGAILADGADVGCGCVLNPGTIIGKNTSVYPMTSVRGVIGEGLIVKSMENIVKRR